MAAEALASIYNHLFDSEIAEITDINTLQAHIKHWLNRHVLTRTCNIVTIFALRIVLLIFTLCIMHNSNLYNSSLDLQHIT